MEGSSCSAKLRSPPSGCRRGERAGADLELGAEDEGKLLLGQAEESSVWPQTRRELEQRKPGDEAWEQPRGARQHSKPRGTEVEAKREKSEAVPGQGERPSGTRRVQPGVCRRWSLGAAEGSSTTLKAEGDRGRGHTRPRGEAEQDRTDAAGSLPKAEPRSSRGERPSGTGRVQSRGQAEAELTGVVGHGGRRGRWDREELRELAGRCRSGFEAELVRGHTKPSGRGRGRGALGATGRPRPYEAERERPWPRGTRCCWEAEAVRGRAGEAEAGGHSVLLGGRGRTGPSERGQGRGALSSAGRPRPYEADRERPSWSDLRRPKGRG